MEAERLIVDYFRQTALGNENPAIRWGKGNFLRWNELHRKAQCLAQYLIIDCRLQPGDCVAIGLERSADYLVASYAVWIAGGVYFPVDPKTPLARMTSMFATAACDIAFCGEPQRALFLQARPSLRLISCESPAAQYPATTQQEVFTGTPRLQAKDPAYLLFTSGTTGVPKGVLVNHGALINRLSWHRDHSELSHRDIILQRTALSFDVSLWELFLPALCGASNYLLPPGWESLPRGIVAALQSAEVTIAHFVPSLLKPVLQELADGSTVPSPLPALRRVYVSGEALLPSLVEAFQRVFESRCRLTNLYGPTEAAIDVSCYDCAPVARAVIPIGRPIAGCKLYIVDPCTLELQAEGQRGEIAIGGVCLADGYHKQQALTEKVFVIHSVLQERIYLTGDLGWYEQGDTFFCQGRKDTQVKLRGLRIELGEIEHHLLQHPSITAAVVCVVEDQCQEQWLVAAIVAKTKLDSQDIRRFLAAQLPTYMLPARYWQAEELPRSSSGKLDRKQIERSVRAFFFDRSAPQILSSVS